MFIFLRQSNISLTVNYHTPASSNTVTLTFPGESALNPDAHKRQCQTQPGSLWGLITEHKRGLTYRDIGDPKTGASFWMSYRVPPDHGWKPCGVLFSINLPLFNMVCLLIRLLQVGKEVNDGGSPDPPLGLSTITKHLVTT